MGMGIDSIIASKSFNFITYNTKPKNKNKMKKLIHHASNRCHKFHVSDYTHVAYNLFILAAIAGLSYIVYMQYKKIKKMEGGMNA